MVSIEPLERAAAQALGAKRDAGKKAALEALAALNAASSGKVERAASGVPIFPPGFCGSISHTEGAAVAAAGLESHYLSLGVDLEIKYRPTSSRLAARIAGGDEFKQWQESGGSVLGLFGAKEALYKALYPICQRYFGFRAVQLGALSPDGSATAELVSTLAPELPAGKRVRVQILDSAPFQIALAMLGAGEVPR